MRHPNLGHKGRGRPETIRATARRAALRRREKRPPARLRACRTCGEPFEQPYRPGPPRVDCPACHPRRDRAWSSRQGCVCACGRARHRRSRFCRACSAAARQVSPTRRRRQQLAARMARVARLRAVGSKFEKGRWRRICERDGWVCWICGGAIDRELVVPHRRAGTADHVTALKRGGDDSDANLRAAHFFCNSRRGARCIDHLAEPTAA